MHCRAQQNIYAIQFFSGVKHLYLDKTATIFACTALHSGDSLVLNEFGIRLMKGRTEELSVIQLHMQIHPFSLPLHRVRDFFGLPLEVLSPSLMLEDGEAALLLIATSRKASPGVLVPLLYRIPRQHSY